MHDWQDTRDHIRPIDIPRADLARWKTTGRRLENVATAVLAELSDLHTDPSKHRLWRAAKAARYAALIADEP